MNSWLRILRFLWKPGGDENETRLKMTKAKPGHTPSAYGSSRFMTYREAKRARMVGGIDRGKVVLGGAAEAVWNHKPRRGRGWSPFTFKEKPGHIALDLEGHVTCFAPTRSGKTSGIVTPILLSYPGSIVVTDPKAEIFKETVHYRRDVLGQEIHVIDPYGIAGTAPTGFEMNSFVRPDCFHADCKTLARMVAPEKEHDANPFFRDAGYQFIEGMIAFLNTAPDLQPGETRNLSQLGRWMALPPDPFEAFLKRMETSGSPLAAREASKFRQHKDGQLSGVVADINTALDSLKNPDIERALSGGCDLGRLKQTPMTVNLCMPEDQLLNDAVFLRLFLASALAGIKRDPSRPKYRPLVVCDEFQNLGKSPEIARDVSLLAGQGGNFLLFVQSLGRLEELYSPEQVQDFLANSYATIFIRPTDPRTREFVSHALGETTLVQETEEIRRPGPQEFFAQRHRTHRPERRPLLDPSEVSRLPEDYMLVFPQSRPALPVLLRRYFEEKPFIDRLWRRKAAKSELKLKALLRFLLRRLRKDQ